MRPSGEFFTVLRRSGRWEQMVVVVTSDHGEEFFEHGGFEHNRTLYDEMLRVPLLIKSPGLHPGMREIQTQSVDLAPTLACAAGAGHTRRPRRGRPRAGPAARRRIRAGGVRRAPG